ncbi:hypothetical protein BGZ74_003449 [Mortierella antarctica]|nr:hypothetical protein BGZ74_003449 [Mortierella antarctica]
MYTTTLNKISLTILAALLVSSSLQTTTASKLKPACTIRFDGGECYGCKPFTVYGTGSNCAGIQVAAQKYFNDDTAFMAKRAKVTIKLTGECNQQTAMFQEFAGILVQEQLYEGKSCDFMVPQFYAVLQ